MFDLRLFAAGITLAGLGLCATVASVAGLRDAQKPVEETAVAEGELIDISANGQRFTLHDGVPAAQVELKNLFNLSNDTDSDNTPDAPASEARREFVLKPGANTDEMKRGESFRVFYRIGSKPSEVVRIERLPRNISAIENDPNRGRDGSARTRDRIETGPRHPLGAA